MIPGSDPEARKPLIFVVGCPRSGTTLLRDLLRSHSNLTFPDETRFIPSYYRAYGDPSSDRAARRLARAILRFPWIKRWNPDLSPADFASCRSYRATVERLFEEWARHEGKSRCGDKTPGYALEIPTLVQIFPDARFLHLIRDGRDIALSFLNAPFGAVNVFGAAKNWRRIVTAGRRAGSRLGASRYVEMTYETLVTEPESAMRKICEFIDEPFDPGVLHPSRLGERTGKTLVPVSWESITADHVGRWRRSMPESDVAVFESIAGDLLEALGYEVTGGVVPVARARPLWWQIEDGVQRSLNVLRRRNHLVNYVLLRWGSLRARLRSKGWIQ